MSQQRTEQGAGLNGHRLRVALRIDKAADRRLCCPVLHSRSLSCAVLPLATYATQPLPWLIAARFAMGLSSACLLPAFASAAAR